MVKTVDFTRAYHGILKMVWALIDKKLENSNIGDRKRSLIHNRLRYAQVGDAGFDAHKIRFAYKVDKENFAREEIVIPDIFFSNFQMTQNDFDRSFTKFIDEETDRIVAWLIFIAPRTKSN